MRPTRILTIVVVILLVAFVAWGLTGAAVPVETAAVGRGPVRLFVEEEGKTRVAERYVVSAPVSGRLLRVELDEGEVVPAGKVVARIDDLSLRAAVSSARAGIRGTEARLAGVDRQRPKPEELERAGVEAERARAAATLAERELDEARAAADQAHRDADRARKLLSEKTVTESEKEAAELAETRTRAGVAAAEAMLRVRRLEVRSAELGERILKESAHDVDWQEEQAKEEIAAARAELTSIEDDLGRTEIAAPAAGSVLRVFQESQAVVAAGTPILEIGDLSDLEVEADLLSEDAARMRKGLPAEVFGRALGDRVLAGTLARIYPAAFTKISSLGVEQQRTTVVIEFDEPPSGIGDRFRVDVRVVLEEKKDVLTVPEAALFRSGDEWRAFRVKDGEARLVTVETGIRDGRVREVTSGLAEGDEVVLFPPDDLEDGTSVDTE